MNNEAPELWAVVDLFGHQRIAGKVSEYSLGEIFIRVDVPSVNGTPGFTRLFGAKAIYSISFVDRDVALAVAEKLGVVPVMPYDVASLIADAVRDRLKRAALPYDDGSDEVWR
jgi:hypothetical protein